VCRSLLIVPVDFFCLDSIFLEASSFLRRNNLIRLNSDERFPRRLAGMRIHNTSMPQHLKKKDRQWCKNTLKLPGAMYPDMIDPGKSV